MPTYDYECTECGYKFEHFQAMSDNPLSTCSTCGGRLRRLIGGGTGIIFKGSGFYVTDNGKNKNGGHGNGSGKDSDKNGGGASSAESASAESSSSESSSSSSSKESTQKKGDKQPASSRKQPASSDKKSVSSPAAK